MDAGTAAAITLGILCFLIATSSSFAGSVGDAESDKPHDAFLKFVGHEREAPAYKLDNAEKDIRSNKGFSGPDASHISAASAFVPVLHGEGIYPGLAVTADSTGVRSECGVGALMPWADRLYMVSYLSVPGAGHGTGLYEIYSNLTMRKIASHSSTYANRMLHPKSEQIIIGAWAIDGSGAPHEFPDLLHVRVAATAEHLTQPDTMVYMLGMDGPLWECDVMKRTCEQLFDLVKELHIDAAGGEQPHFKAAHTMDGRLVVTSNTFEEADFTRNASGGRLAEWRGPGTEWLILERTAFVEVTGRHNFGKVIYAVGWDDRSAILKTFDGGDGSAPSSDKHWQTYRMPKASHAYDHLWQTEWPRIREVETERYLMDVHGQFYELSPLGWAGSTFGLRPIAQHLRVIPDFASFRGFLVLGGNQVSSIFDNNLMTGQSQSGLWFGKTDDLWKFGKPQGWGAVWRRDNVTADTPSDPYLMTGFDKKVVHLHLHHVDTSHDPEDRARSSNSDNPTVEDYIYDPAPYAGSVNIAVQVDFTGTAGHMEDDEWVTMTTISLEFTKSSYTYYVFPTGFSAHWARLVVDKNCSITAYFHYT